MEQKIIQPYISSSRIKELASQIGFDSCGICRPFIQEEEKEYFNNWLKNGFHGSMNYLSNTEKRFDPALVLPEVQSVVMFLLSYNTKEKQNDNSFYKISKYAYGEDYHLIIKSKLEELEALIKAENKEIRTFSFVDASSVWEKLWAKKAGLGSIGKHSIIINKSLGSFCFIGGFLMNAVSEYDDEAVDICGSCELCINSCPTNAIASAHCIDTRRCISFHTIENKSDIPESLSNSFQNNIYGCDICQNACPFNSTAIYKNHFKPNHTVLNLSKEKWENMNEQQFSELFSSSVIKRTGFKRMKRNIFFVHNSYK